MTTMSDTQEIPWIEQEFREVSETTTTQEKLPYMKFEENKIQDIEIDFTKPFQKYHQAAGQGKREVTKAIVPVTHAGIKKNWWLNTKNPVYLEILELASDGQTKFKVLQTGSQANTKYVLIK